MDFLKPDVQERLTKDNFEFRKLMEEHVAADQRLQILVNKVRLTSQEALEEAALKKVKLRAKERIYQMVMEDAKQHG
ncbi:MAG: YdcH family protein [Firmicutes bacterium]|nr:YdcH family protein [Bacillota bacterium]